MEIRFKWTVFLNKKKIAEIDETKELDEEGVNFVIDLQKKETSP